MYRSMCHTNYIFIEVLVPGFTHKVDMPCLFLTKRGMHVQAVCTVVAQDQQQIQLFGLLCPSFTGPLTVVEADAFNSPI